MNPKDFVFDQIYKQSLKSGASSVNAHAQAVMGLDDFKKGKFSGGRVSKLIEDRVKKAKRASK